jgi:hypothetical protein
LGKISKSILGKISKSILGKIKKIYFGKFQTTIKGLKFCPPTKKSTGCHASTRDGRFAREVKEKKWG